jgi:tRNA modification GTPase
VWSGEPIVALASPRGRAALAVIRLSGKGTRELLQNCLVPRHPAKPWTYRELRYCNFLNTRTQVTLDDVTAVFYPQGQSYTGEESAEILCHGGLYITDLLLLELQQAGFRLAEPGEFTRRAYLNGKLDLTAAEGIHALIQAVSEQQWQAGRSLVDAGLRDHIQQLRAVLIKALAYLEAGIDFPDEGETKSLDMGPVLKNTAELRLQLDTLLRTYTSGQVMHDGLKVALLGVPNAGKSTLLNALLRKDRAIVSDIPGTTRDYLEEACLLRGRLLRVIDTAGLRETSDPIEAQGMQRAVQIAQDADLVLCLYPANLADAELAIFRAALVAIPQDHQFPLLTKADLGTPSWGQEFLKVSLPDSNSQPIELEDALCAFVDRQIHAFKETPVSLVTLRQKNCVEQGLLGLERFYSAVREGMYEECLAFELQAVAKSLAELIGEVAVDDVLDEVFSTFCLGK